MCEGPHHNYVNRLCFLHISDIHYDDKSADFYNELKLDLLEEESLDGIFVTGDLANHTSAPDDKIKYESYLIKACSLLKSLKKYLKNDSQNNIYIVPGNHDKDLSIIDTTKEKYDLSPFKQFSSITNLAFGKTNKNYAENDIIVSSPKFNVITLNTEIDYSQDTIIDPNTKIESKKGKPKINFINSDFTRIKSTWASNKDKPTFIIGHRASTQFTNDFGKQIQYFQPIAYICGHEHAEQTVKTPGLITIQTGSFLEQCELLEWTGDRFFRTTYKHTKQSKEEYGEPIYTKTTRKIEEPRYTDIYENTVNSVLNKIGDEKLVLVYGKKYSGKTTVAINCIYQLANRKEGDSAVSIYDPIYLNVRNCEETDIIEKMISSLPNHCFTDQNAQDLLIRINDRTNQNNQKIKTVFFLDNIKELKIVKNISDKLNSERICIVALSDSLNKNGDVVEVSYGKRGLYTFFKTRYGKPIRSDKVRVIENWCKNRTSPNEVMAVAALCNKDGSIIDLLSGNVGIKSILKNKELLNDGDRAILALMRIVKKPIPAETILKGNNISYKNIVELNMCKYDYGCLDDPLEIDDSIETNNELQKLINGYCRFIVDHDLSDYYSHAIVIYKWLLDNKLFDRLAEMKHITRDFIKKTRYQLDDSIELFDQLIKTNDTILNGITDICKIKHEQIINERLLRNELSLLYFRRGDLKEARDSYSNVNVDSKYPSLRSNIGLASIKMRCYDLKNLENELFDLKTVASIDSRLLHTRITKMLGDYYYLTGNFSEAKKYYMRAIDNYKNKKDRFSLESVAYSLYGLSDCNILDGGLEISTYLDLMSKLYKTHINFGIASTVHISVQCPRLPYYVRKFDINIKEIESGTNYINTIYNKIIENNDKYEKLIHAEIMLLKGDFIGAYSGFERLSKRKSTISTLAKHGMADCLLNYNHNLKNKDYISPYSINALKESIELYEKILDEYTNRNEEYTKLLILIVNRSRADAYRRLDKRNYASHYYNESFILLDGVITNNGDGIS